MLCIGCILPPVEDRDQGVHVVGAGRRQPPVGTVKAISTTPPPAYLQRKAMPPYSLLLFLFTLACLVMCQ